MTTWADQFNPHRKRKLMNNNIIKSCDTCIYQQGRGEFARCSRAGVFCSVAREFAYSKITQCNENFSGWVTRPLRRSFAKWFYDTFLKLEK